VVLPSLKAAGTAWNRSPKLGSRSSRRTSPTCARSSVPVKLPLGLPLVTGSSACSGLSLRPAWPGALRSQPAQAASPRGHQKAAEAQTRYDGRTPDRRYFLTDCRSEVRMAKADFNCNPRVLTTVIMATEIPAAIRP
jgi:hypothetical protein